MISPLLSLSDLPNVYILCIAFLQFFSQRVFSVANFCLVLPLLHLNSFLRKVFIASGAHCLRVEYKLVHFS